MNPSAYNRAAKRISRSSGEKHLTVLGRLRRDAVRRALAGSAVVDAGEIARLTGLELDVVRQVLGYLQNQQDSALSRCSACRLLRADAECERCGEENHAACLEEVAGR